MYKRQALRRAGRRTDARAPLTEALDLAARCGARPLAQRARDELIAMGARPRREHRRGIESLTPSELRVVELARDGLSNREIALRLYVTVKTVEGHLARAYTKLAISGRAALREAMPAKVEGRDPVANVDAAASGRQSRRNDPANVCGSDRAGRTEATGPPGR